jgi:hypothetical protein
LWIREDGLILSCASTRGSLIEATSGKVLWSSDSNFFTRGLACTKDALFVGASEHAPYAKDRRSCHGGIWVLDPETWQARNYVDLGRVGAIHDVRILDEPDFCHPNGIVGLTPELEGKDDICFRDEKSV